MILHYGYRLIPLLITRIPHYLDNMRRSSLVKQLVSIASNPKHLEQVSAKDQTRFLQQELNACTREREMLIAQLKQLTPAV